MGRHKNKASEKVKITIKCVNTMLWFLTFDVKDCAIHETFTSHYFNLISLRWCTIQGGPAKVRPTLLVTFECAGKIQWFLAIWRIILNIKFLLFPRCVSILLSHLPKTTEFYLCKCYQNNVTSKNVSWPHFSWATL